MITFEGLLRYQMNAKSLLTHMNFWKESILAKFILEMWDLFIVILLFSYKDTNN